MALTLARLVRRVSELVRRDARPRPHVPPRQVTKEFASVFIEEDTCTDDESLHVAEVCLAILYANKCTGSVSAGFL
jgi:hypothetical protein